MTIDDHDSLDATTWFERMERFADGLSMASEEPARHIRKAYHLNCLAPPALKPLMAAPVEEERLEAMLDCGAYESAVSCMIGPAGKVTVSSDRAEGGIQVTMRVRPGETNAQDTSGDWPIALLEAWAVSFLRLRPRPH